MILMNSPLNTPCLRFPLLNSNLDSSLGYVQQLLTIS